MTAMFSFQHFRDFMNAHPLRWLALYVTLAMLLVFAVPAAFAADAQLTWTNPTQHTDNTPIPATGTGRLLLTRIEYGTCAGTAPNYTFGTKAGESLFNVPATSGTISGHAGGSTVCFRAYAQLASGTESAPTGVVYKTFAPSVPQPPASLAVTELIAYTVVKQRDRFVLLPVGTVPANTQCDPTQSVNGHYVVPRAAVTWSGSVKPDVVVAKCG